MGCAETETCTSVLIGMGRSGKPDIAYKFADHARYFDAWFDALALDDVVLIGHDLGGGALAFDWATRHPGRASGVAFFETIVRPMAWDDFPGPARPR
jgi:haloalkane dehalogenase